MIANSHILGDVLDDRAGRQDNGPRSSCALPLPPNLGETVEDPVQIYTGASTVVNVRDC